MTAADDPYIGCDSCQTYIHARYPALLPHVVRHALPRGIDPAELLRRFMRGVHHRHQAGLPILPTTTPRPRPRAARRTETTVSG